VLLKWLGPLSLDVVSNSVSRELIDITLLIFSVFCRGGGEELEAWSWGQGAVGHDGDAGANEATCLWQTGNIWIAKVLNGRISKSATSVLAWILHWAVDLINFHCVIGRGGVIEIWLGRWLSHFEIMQTFSNIDLLLTIHVISSTPVYQIFRAIFCCDEKSHSGHMKAVTQSVLDGTSKWSAKIAITGLH
jgi:hypothetical protein